MIKMEKHPKNLTWNGVCKSVRVFSNECVLDMSPANTMSSYTWWIAKKCSDSFISVIIVYKKTNVRHT